MGCGHCLSWLNLLDQPLLCLLMVHFNRGFGIESTPSRIHLFDQHFQSTGYDDEHWSCGWVGGQQAGGGLCQGVAVTAKLQHTLDIFQRSAAGLSIVLKKRTRLALDSDWQHLAPSMSPGCTAM